MRSTCHQSRCAPCGRQICPVGPAVQHLRRSNSQQRCQHMRSLQPTWRTSVQAAAGEASAGSSSSSGGKVLWYQKNKELWKELETEEDYAATLAALAPGQLLVVDYYAGWCAVCKSSYPNLCRIVSDPKWASGHYVFAKGSLDNPEVKARIKREGISGIPWIGIYNKQGEKVASMGAAFKRLEAVRHNLHLLADHKDQIHLAKPDPNGFLVIPGVSCALPRGIIPSSGSEGPSEATSPLASTS